MQMLKPEGGNTKTGLEVKKSVSIPKLKPIKVKSLCEESARDIFRAYFNNKMTVILLLLQKRRVEPDSYSAMRAVIFFDDLYHHMLPNAYQQSHGRVFQWLKLFFKRFPYVKPLQKRKALEYLKIIYQLFGMKLNVTDAGIGRRDGHA